MEVLDLGVLAVFLGGTVWLGLSRTSGQTTLADYFTTNRRAPWPVVMASIVAT
ncbi:MAG TPA: sodium:solute symporter, partial [Acidobacteria bacterium]|nr:sodium:solute symporter [Acidobacteriota bacterium]